MKNHNIMNLKKFILNSVFLILITMNLFGFSSIPHNIHAIVIEFPHYTNQFYIEHYVEFCMNKLNKDNSQIIKKITELGGEIKQFNNLTSSQLLCVLPTLKTDAKEIFINLLKEIKDIFNNNLRNFSNNYTYNLNTIHWVKNYIFKKFYQNKQIIKPNIYVTNNLTNYKNELLNIINEIQLYTNPIYNFGNFSYSNLLDLISTSSDLSWNIIESTNENIKDVRKEQKIQIEKENTNNAYQYYIFTWFNITNYLEFFLSAKYLGECFINLIPSQYISRYEIWNFKNDLFLVLECGTNIFTLGEVENYLHEFIASIDKLASCKQKWEKFCTQSYNLLLNDLLDFEKAIVTLAWVTNRNNKLEFQIPANLRFIKPQNATFINFLPKSYTNLIAPSHKTNPIIVTYSDLHSNQFLKDFFLSEMTKVNSNKISNFKNYFSKDEYSITVNEITDINKISSELEYTSAPVYILYGIKTPYIPIYSHITFRKQKNHLQDIVNSYLEFDKSENITIWYISTNFENLMLVNFEVQKILFEIFYENNKNKLITKTSVSNNDFYDIYIVVYSTINPYKIYNKIAKGWQISHVDSSSLKKFTDLSEYEKQKILTFLFDDPNNIDHNESFEKLKSKSKIKLSNVITKSKFFIKLLANKISPYILDEIFMEQ